MKRGVALGVVLALAAVSALAQTKAGSAADEAALRELAKQYAAAWNSGDAAKAAAVYADDGMFVTITGTPIVGRPEIEKSMAKDLAGDMKGSTFDVTMDTIRFIRPDTAMVVGTTLIKGAAMGPPEGLKGHYLLVATKQGSAWRVLAVHAAAMPPPLPPK